MTGLNILCTDPRVGTLTDAGKDQRDASQSTHYRSFHFRQLMHERYYKNEYENIPVGSRIVPVRDTFVNKDIEPSTFVEEQINEEKPIIVRDEERLAGT